MRDPNQLTLATMLEPANAAGRRVTTGGPSPNPGVRGAEFRSLVARVVAERERTLRYGWCRLNPAAVRLRMQPLEQWLRDHIGFISDAECRRCWAEHADALNIITPTNAFGRKAILRMQELVAQCMANSY